MLLNHVKDISVAINGEHFISLPHTTILC